MIETHFIARNDFKPNYKGIIFTTYCYKLVRGFRVTVYSLLSTILKVMT